MTPTDDPILTSEVENAIAPYRSLLPPEAIEILRTTILQAYTEHPAGQRILQKLRADVASTNESGHVETLKSSEITPQDIRAIASAKGRGKAR